MFIIYGTGSKIKTWKVKHLGQEKVLEATIHNFHIFYILRFDTVTTWKLIAEDGSQQSLSSREVESAFGINKNSPVEGYYKSNSNIVSPVTEPNLESKRSSSSPDSQQKTNEANPISIIWTVLKYIFGSLFLLIALLMVLNSFAVTLIFLFLSAITFPPLSKLFEKHLLKIPRIAKFILVPVLFIGSLMAIDTDKGIDGKKLVKDKTSKEDTLAYIEQSYKKLVQAYDNVQGQSHTVTKCDFETKEPTKLKKVNLQYLLIFKNQEKEIYDDKDWSWITSYFFKSLNMVDEIVTKDNQFNLSDNYSKLKKLNEEKYIAVLKLETQTLPKVLENGFQSGVYDGWLAIYDLNSEKIVCANKLQIASSESVRTFSKGFVTKSKKESSLMSDFKKNFKNELKSKAKEINVEIYGI